MNIILAKNIISSRKNVNILYIHIIIMTMILIVEAEEGAPSEQLEYE